MALVIRAVAPKQINTSGSTTTQTYTIAGFGTPQAAIIYYHMGGTNDTDIPHRLYGVGFFDGTTQACSYVYRHDAVSTTTSVASGTWSKVLYAYTANGGGNSVRSSTAASWTTDGISISYDAGTPQPYVTVILIKGATGAKVGNLITSASDSGTASASSLGINPNALIAVHSYVSTNDTNTGEALLTMGFASKVGASPYVQRAVEYDDHTAPTVASARLMTNRIGLLSNANNGGTPYTRGYYELTDFGTGSFTVTTRAGAVTTAAVSMNYLALELPQSPDIFTATAPTGAGNWDPYTGTAQPVAVMMIPTAMTGADTVYDTGDAAAGCGFYIVTPNEEFGSYGVSRDNVATTDASTRMNTRLLVQGELGGAPTFEAYGPTFDSTGLVYPDANTTNASAAYKIPGMAFLDTSLTKKLKLLAHSSAAYPTPASDIAGVVFSSPSPGAITGTTRYGEFTGATFESSLESGKAVLKVPVANFGGTALATSDTPVALVRNTTNTTGIVSCTVIEE